MGLKTYAPKLEVFDAIQFTGENAVEVMDLLEKNKNLEAFASRFNEWVGYGRRDIGVNSFTRIHKGDWVCIYGNGMEFNIVPDSQFKGKYKQVERAKPLWIIIEKPEDFPADETDREWLDSRGRRWYWEMYADADRDDCGWTTGGLHYDAPQEHLFPVTEIIK